MSNYYKKKKLLSAEVGKMSVVIKGMHCASCEVLIERKFKKIEGIEVVSVNQAAGRADITYVRKPELGQLQEALHGTEYLVAPFDKSGQNKRGTVHATTTHDYIETAWVFLVVAGLYTFLNYFHLVPRGLSVGTNMSYGFIFAIGLVAAVSSCIAVTGGLLVAVASRYAEVYPQATGIQKFRSHLFFNIGRVIGYTIFGGLVGALGSVFTLSTRTTGILTIAASLVMIFLGFQLLNIFPGLRKLQVKMPKFIAHRIHDVSSRSQHPIAPCILGAVTFFLPCGFTQALQLYVLSRGSFTVGALTMLAFSLGTLPALMSLSVLSSFLKGTGQRYFFRFAGVIVVLLGIFNIGNGFTLVGANFSLAAILSNTATAEEVADLAPLVGGKQIIRLKVVGYQYQPAHFIVRRGVPVEWHIDGTQAAGCAGTVIDSGLNITASLSRNEEKVVTFTPDKTGVFGFTCPMGMTTRGASIEVVENPTQSPSVSTGDSSLPLSSATGTGSAEVQRFTMTVTREQGFDPNSFTAKKDILVELVVDVRTNIGGCMSTMISSDYGIAQQLKMGKNYIHFTPTKVGVVRLTCPMGIRMGQFTITD